MDWLGRIQYTFDTVFNLIETDKGLHLDKANDIKDGNKDRSSAAFRQVKEGRFVATKYPWKTHSGRKEIRKKR
jgi:hypothetical protein